MSNDSSSFEPGSNPRKGMRVVIERHPNPDVTTYHLNRIMSQSRRSISFEFDSGEVKPSCLFTSEKEKNVEPFAQSLAERLYAIHGIASDSILSGGIMISMFEVRVSKGKAFDDEEIEPHVLTALAEAFGLSVDDIDVRIDDYQRSAEYRREAAEEERMMSGMYPASSDSLDEM